MKTKVEHINYICELCAANNWYICILFIYLFAFRLSFNFYGWCDNQMIFTDRIHVNVNVNGFCSKRLVSNAILFQNVVSALTYILLHCTLEYLYMYCSSLHLLHRKPTTVQPLSLCIMITVVIPFGATPAAFWFPMLRLFRVTLFFFWSVGRFEAFTERPWYIKVEEFRSFLNFFISGALSEGPYLKYVKNDQDKFLPYM